MALIGASPLLWLGIGILITVMSVIKRESISRHKGPVLKTFAAVIAITLIIWLEWPWPRVQSRFQSMVEKKYEPIVDSTSIYWAGYMTEREALRVMGYYAALILNYPQSDVVVRTLIQETVRESNVQIRWRPIGTDEWRYDLPKDSVDAIFEIEKYGPRKFGEKKLFEREYYKSSVMVIGRANWKEPDWKIPQIK